MREKVNILGEKEVDGIHVTRKQGVNNYRGEVTSRRGFEGQKWQSNQNRVDVKICNKPIILHASFLKLIFKK